MLIILIYCETVILRRGMEGSKMKILLISFAIVLSAGLVWAGKTRKQTDN